MLTPTLTREDLATKPTLTVDDITTFLGVSRDTLERWRRRGAFPKPRVLPGGRVLRWDTCEVLSWWDELERAA